jgi:hypothetical protein
MPAGANAFEIATNAHLRGFKEEPKHAERHRLHRAREKTFLAKEKHWVQG